MIYRSHNLENGHEHHSCRLGHHFKEPGVTAMQHLIKRNRLISKRKESQVLGANYRSRTESSL